MNKPLFNVIIPVYNAEKYVSNAIESVLNQTYDNINLILVDDGSTDNSGYICDKYVTKNKNVRVIHTNNQGLASARNNGMNIVTEGYISFLDADDCFCDITMFEKVKDVIDLNNPDYIDFGINYVGSGGILSVSQNEIEKNKFFDKKIIFDKVLPRLLNLNNCDDYFVLDYVWNKIYKYEIIKEHNISFFNGRKVWEDRPFLIEYLNFCKSFYSMSDHFYDYVNVPNSLSQKYTNDFFDVILENYHMYRNNFENIYNFETQYVYDYWSNSLINILKQSLKQNRVDSKSVRLKLIEVFTTEDVVDLFEKKKCVNRNDRIVLKYIIDGDIDNLIKFYKKVTKKESKQSIVKRILSKVRGGL